MAGVDEPKEELQEIIEFLREPQKFQKLGGRIPKGVLLMGPPGTGKTLLARAVAGEAHVPFFTISGSDFVEMFVGVGASRVRDLFAQSKKNAPCIIFIDEIDAVGRHRGAGIGGGHDEREQTLNQLLVEMDGFEPNEGVILVAATNRPDVLDPALLRPGRFDRRIVVSLPDVRGREGILGVHTRKIPLADNVDVHVLARGTPGLSGADLANLVNEAALNAARHNQKAVQMPDFEFAKDKVLMGSERRSLVISDAEKQVTAVHEAGHALLTVLLPNADPIHKVTIIPRGMALGVTQQLPVDDKHNASRDYLDDQIAILLGGRIAEELTQEAITTGAGNDLDRVTDLARRMVCEWGMSGAMGPLTFGKKEGLCLADELLARRSLEGLGNGWARTPEQRGKEFGEVDESLSCGADDAGEDLLGLRAAGRPIAATDFAIDDGRADGLLGTPVGRVHLGRPQEGEHGGEFAVEMGGEALGGRQGGRRVEEPPEAREQAPTGHGEAVIGERVCRPSVAEREGVGEDRLHAGRPRTVRMIRGQRACPS